VRILNFQIWKWIKGFEGSYQISDEGNVRSFKYSKEFPRYLKLSKNSCGYLLVALYNKGLKQYYYVHRLVAEAFIPNPENKPQVNHKNGIRDKNKTLNLEWATPSENARHGYVELGRKALKGENSCRSKLTEEQVLEIRRSSLSEKELASIYSVNQASINNVKNRKRWKHID
jgi:hypothetical protein